MSATASSKFSKLPFYVAVSGLVSHFFLSKFLSTLGLDPVAAKLFVNSAVLFLAAVLLVYLVCYMKFIVVELGKCVFISIDVWEKIAARLRKIRDDRKRRQRRPRLSAHN